VLRQTTKAQAIKTMPATKNDAVKKETKQRPNKLSYHLQKELDQLPEKVEQLEAKISRLQAKSVIRLFSLNPTKKRSRCLKC